MECKSIATLESFKVEFGLFTARLSIEGDNFNIIRVLHQVEKTRHSKNRTLSYYFLLQSLFIAFEEVHGRLSSVFVQDSVVESWDLQYLLFIKVWPASTPLDTPLFRIKFAKRSARTVFHSG